MTSNEKVPGVEPWPIPPELTITWYASPEEVHGSLWSEAAAEHGVTVEELLQGTEVGALDENGQEVSISQEQVLEGMRAMGCWGWVDTELKVIHAWMAPDADPGLVAHFLAHEIGHVTGHPDPDDFQEEMRAEQFGYVASQALRLLQQAEGYHRAGLQARVWELLEERNRTGLAIDKAIMVGEVPEQHPLLSRLQLLANHRQREQSLADGMVKMAERYNQLLELLGEAGSVMRSINRGHHNKVEIEGDEPAYWQRGEWVDWAMNEVLPRVDAALADHIGEANEKAPYVEPDKPGLPEPSSAACQLPAGLDLGFIECCLGDYLSRRESGEIMYGCDNLEYLGQQITLIAGAVRPPKSDPLADLLREALGPLRTGLGFVRNFHIIDRIEKALGPSAASCWCQACRPVTVDDMRLVVCPDCGNKRCPRANDHVYPCTGSNEPEKLEPGHTQKENISFV